MTRRWTINGRFLTQRVTGVQRYATEIVEAMDRLIAAGDPLARDLEVELVAPPNMANPPALSAINLRIAGAPTIGAAAGHLWEQLVLPGRHGGGVLSLGNTGPVRGRRNIVCMHDLNTRSYPASYSLPYRLLQRVLGTVLGKSAVTISTVSRFSAGQLVAHRVCRASKLIVVPNGHEHALQWQARHSELSQAVAGPETIVVIGSPAPHKNIGLLINMADTLAQNGLRLAIVGNVDSRVLRRTEEGDPAANVHWLGRLSDEALTALLTDCLCLAFPSYVEGFGLPPLEAMAIGCPVVTSDRTSLPEVCGSAALYASPDDPQAWLDCFVRLKRDKALRAELISAGRTQARRFSWIQSAGLYLRAMAAVDGVVEAPDTNFGR